MEDLPRLILQFAIISASCVAGGFISTKIRDRGRGEWNTMVGRPPRDLFADRRINFIANLIHEWMWIGAAVAFTGVVLMFFDSTAGFADFVFWFGVAMMFVRGIGTSFCLLYARLAPQYEAKAADAADARAA